MVTSHLGELPARAAPVRVASDVFHWAMAIFNAVRLGFDQSDTAPTYYYGHHLQNVSAFDRKFRRHLAADPARIADWTNRKLFVDFVRDPSDFADFPAGTVGREYYEMCQRHEHEGLLELRKRRLETMPEEKKGLALDEIANITDPEELYQRIVARRNIFMTSTHDLCHLFTGSPTDVPGEAIAACYQYIHLWSPQNWLNMKLSMLSQLCALRITRIFKLRACFSAIKKSRNYAYLDYNEIWPMQLTDLRRQLDLPANGYVLEDGRILVVSG